jgi:hypothetical protein
VKLDLLRKLFVFLNLYRGGKGNFLGVFRFLVYHETWHTFSGSGVTVIAEWTA